MVCITFAGITAPGGTMSAGDSGASGVRYSLQTYGLGGEGEEEEFSVIFGRVPVRLPVGAERATIDKLCHIKEREPYAG